MGSDDMTETDDSEYEDPDEREIRLNVNNDNYDLSEGDDPCDIYPSPTKEPAPEVRGSEEKGTKNRRIY